MIKLDYKSGATLHEQVEGEIKKLIISGILKPDEQLPSVRELSISLTINPNTVQRAYKKLEQDGFIYSIKGKGNFVAHVSENADGKHRMQTLAEFKRIARELAFLGEDKETLMSVIAQTYSEKEENS